MSAHPAGAAPALCAALALFAAIDSELQAARPRA
ncbi:hypothetical protein FHR93_001426 [Geodermatophilus sabuli]|nr:hypothetical protein [Geodermatophilus sabuli]